MRTPLLALFDRSLRVDARTRSVFGARVALLAIILFSLFQVQQMSRFGFLGAPGLQLFRSVLWINVVFISLAGLSYFASAITEEKEEMMLGLLRMTDLNALSILLGKSTSRLVGAGMLLLAQVPFTLLAVTLGGVSTGQVVAAYCTLLAYVFLLCNIALFSSVVFRRTPVAAFITGVMVWILFVLPTWTLPTLKVMTGNLAGTDGWRTWLIKSLQLVTGVSPWSRLSVVLQTGFAGGPIGLQVISNIGIGIVFFLLAWLVFEPCTRNQHEDAPVRGIVTLRKGRSARVPAGVCGAGAITWKDFRFVAGGVPGLFVKSVVFGLAIAGFGTLFSRMVGTSVTREVVGGYIMITSLIVAAVSLAIDASRIFKSEVRWKTLSSLMVLPFSVSEIAYRKVLGSIAGITPYLLCFATGALLLPKGVSQFFEEIMREPRGIAILMIIVSQYLLFLHLVAYLSLVVKRGALPLAIVIQYIGGMFLAIPFGMVFMVGGTGSQDWGFVFILVGTVVMTLILHRAVGWRLVRAAAEE